LVAWNWAEFQSSSNSRPRVLEPPIESSITFFYTYDLDTSIQFYEDVLGLELWLDQGSCRIYRVSGDGYVGLCQSSETKTPLTDKQSNVIFTLVTQQVDEWFNYLTLRGGHSYY
jgi:catechol 2,3-dioxygenase-like lactoylglutathione lyase family enzyme